MSLRAVAGKSRGKPGVNCVTKPGEFAGEEVIGIFHDNQVVLPREGGYEGFDFADFAVFVVATVHEKLRLVAVAQERKIGIVDRDAQADEMRNALVFATDSQAHPGTKTETSDQEGNAGEFHGQIIKSGADIASLTAAAVVPAGAEPCAAKIET